MFFCAEEVSPIVGGREHGSDGFEMDYDILYIYVYIYIYIYITAINVLLIAVLIPSPIQKCFKTLM
jgi:hypothetical protein